MSTNQIIKGCLKNEIILYKNEKHVISKMNACHLTFEKSCVSKMRTCWLTFKKSMHFKYKCIRFSNLSLFVSGQFWVHDVLKNKRFCLRNKNPVLTVLFYFISELKNSNWTNRKFIMNIFLKIKPNVTL